MKTIRNEVELFAKLERTFYRRPDYIDFQIDWVYDFSVTAWHLNDWVAKSQKEKLHSIQEKSRNDCPALSICELVCNGFKHYRLDDSRLKDFLIEKNVRLSQDRVGISKPGRAGSNHNFNISLTTAVKIIDQDGNYWDALKVFLEVLDYWRKILKISSMDDA